VYTATQVIERELGDVTWAAYRLGDDIQRALIDLAFDMATLSFARVATRTAGWTTQLQDSVRLLGTDSGVQATSEQARNNFEVYNLVKNVRTLVPVPHDGPVDLERLIRAAYALGSYADLWAIEGLGHDYADVCLDRGMSAGILREGPAEALPAASLTMMHAGLGLALAQRMLPRLTPCASPGEFAVVAAEFIAACDAHGRAGYRGAAYESLGLVARTWHPQLVPGLDAALRRMDERIAGHFWHGAGRALYFLPAYIIPVLSPWRAADSEAGDELARRNLYAGLAWAWTLVNIRQPWILAQLLGRPESPLTASEAFANGVASALVVREDITPAGEWAGAFAREMTDDRRRSASAWNAIVVPAARAALTRYAAVLRAHTMLDVVFRYTDLAGLVSSLERGGAAARQPPAHDGSSRAGVPAADPRPGLYPSSGKAP
jgi:hypothetical protein